MSHEEEKLTPGESELEAALGGLRPASPRFKVEQIEARGLLNRQRRGAPLWAGLGAGAADASWAGDCGGAGNRSGGGDVGAARRADGGSRQNCSARSAGGERCEN